MDPEIFAALISPLRYCGLLEAAYTCAVALDPTIRTSIVHRWFLQRDNKCVASTNLPDNPYIVALSLAEMGRGNEAVTALRTLEEKIKTRTRDFMMAARTMIEGDTEGSIAAVRRILSSGFRDPEALLYLTRHLAQLDQAEAALELLSGWSEAGTLVIPPYPAIRGSIPFGQGHNS